MEIVIKGNTIYPVQARPVNRPDLLPTYLDTKKVAALAETPIMQKLEATILVPGKASVVVATSPDQVHFAITLEEAQNSYDKEKHQAVIVTRPEPANSHPVVNFSALGTPCLVMENGDKAQELLKKASPKHPVVIDMQTGVVQLWDTAKGDVNNYISKGFAVHPAKIAISLPVTEAPKPSTAPSEVPQEVKDLVVAIRSATTHAVAKQRLAELRQHGWVTSIKKHKAELANHKVVPKAAQIHSVLDELDQKIEAAFDEVEAVLQQAPETARLRPLIQIKVLETLLIGKPTHDTSLGQYSLIDAEPLYRDAKILVDYQKKFSHPVHFADIYLAGAKAFEESTQKDWQSFLEDLEQRVQSGEVTLSQIKQLHALVSTLERTGTLTTWFTFFFKKVPIDEVLATLPTNDAKTIDTLMKLGNTIQTSKDKLDDFADPKTFPAAWKRLQAFAESLTGVGPTSVSELFKTESPLPRLMIINIMNESVDLFDRAIKQMKASSAWTPEEKVPIFKEMLSAYFTLLERWSTQLEPELSTLTNSNWTLESYLEKMKMLFEKFGNHPEQLQTTAGFSVTAAALGSKADFQFHHPQSLEDFFTLVHQNHLSVISNLNGKVFSPQVLGQSLLPEHFKQALAQADAAKMEGVRGEQQRIGISITENAASVKYNIPLRQHSAQMNLKYDKSNKKMTLEASIYGGNEFERWGITHFLSLFLEKLGIFRLTKPIHQTEQEITLALNIEDMQHLKWALEEFDNLCQQSYSLQYKDHDQELIKMVTRYGFSNQDVVRVFGSLNYEDPFIRLGLRTGFKFETLIDKGLFTFEKLTDLAQKGMSDHDRDVRANALKSFIVLVRSQKSLEEATRAAGVGINDNDSTVRRTSLDLFDYLVDRDCAYEEALLAAEKGLTDDDSGVRTKSISLFQTLYSRDKYSMHIPIRKVIRAAKIGAYDNNQYVHTAALRLLQTLVHSGYAFEEAELAATESLSNPFSFAFSQSISKEILEEIDQRTSFLGWLVWTLSILSIASLEVKK